MKTKNDLDKFATLIAESAEGPPCSTLPCFVPLRTRGYCKRPWATQACFKTVRAALLKAAAPEVVREFVKRVNARAEQDILDGNPITGAHHRAIEAELAVTESWWQA
jgi:hypothetical protein